MSGAHGRGGVAERSERGLTLIELMITVAIIGFLMAAAAVLIKPAGYARTARGFADEIAATADNVRQRSLVSRAWQRLIVTTGAYDANGAPATTTIAIKQASVTGFDKPADGNDCPNPVVPADPPCWLHMGQLSSPLHGVAVIAADTTPHVNPSGGVLDNSNLPLTLDFAPDGSGQGATLFVGEPSRSGNARVLVFSVTGTALVYDRW